MYCHTEKVYLCLDYHCSLFWTPWSVWYVFFVKQDTFVERMHKTRRYLVLAAPLILDELLVILLTRRLPLCLRLTRKWHKIILIWEPINSIPLAGGVSGGFFRWGRSRGFQGEKMGGSVIANRVERGGTDENWLLIRGDHSNTMNLYKRGGMR